MAKFHGDQPRELGGSPAKEKNITGKKHKAFGTNDRGGLTRRGNSSDVSKCYVISCVCVLFVFFCKTW